MRGAMKPASRSPHVPRKPSLKRSSVLPQALDMGRRKKVKFADSASIHGQSCKQDASLLPSERPLAPSSDDGKTFEYKSFKKLLEETCHKHHCYRLSKEDRNLTTHEASVPMEEFNNKITSNYDVENSSLCILKGTLFGTRSSHSPATVENSELNDTITNNYKTSNFSSPMKMVTPFVQRSFLSPTLASQKCGPECEHGGLFLKKREKLLHLAADAFSLQVPEFTLNRSELIPELLQRLGTKENLSNCNELPKPVQKNANGRCQSLTSSKSDSSFEDVHAAFRTESQAFPTWHDSEGQLLASSKLGTHFEESLELGGVELIATSPRKRLRNKLLTDSFKKADELILSARACIDAQEFPSWCTSETGFHCGKGPSKWVSDSTELSGRYSDFESASTVELRTDFEFSRIQCHEVDHLLGKPNYLDPGNSPFHCQIMEQALVPFTNSSSFKSCGIHNSDFLNPTREQCTLPLLGWGGQNIEKETDLSVDTSDSMLPLELDHLPLTVYSGPSFLDQTKGCMFNDVCGRRYKFSSPPSSRRKITDWDGSYQNLHNIVRSRPGLKHKCMSSPQYFNREYCSQFYTGLQFHDDSIEDILNCMSSGYILQGL